MRAHNLMLSIVLCTLAVSGCDSFATPETAAPDASEPAPCIASTATAAAACEPGRVLAYLPKRRGDDREPLAVAARHCDFGRAVVWNDGGIVCMAVARAADAPIPAP